MTKHFHSKPWRRAASWAAVGLATMQLLYAGTALTADAPLSITPLPETKPASAAMVNLGRQLFFENRLAGDWGSSCASCHDPKKGFGEG